MSVSANSFFRATKSKVARRIEVFGRQSRPGWTVFGNQSEKFDTAGGADQ